MFAKECMRKDGKLVRFATNDDIGAYYVSPNGTAWYYSNQWINQGNVKDVVLKIAVGELRGKLDSDYSDVIKTKPTCWQGD